MAYREPTLCSDGEGPVGHRPAVATTAPPSAEHLKKLMALRDDFVQISSGGRFVDSASREWRELPHNWRMALLMLAGVGLEVDDMSTLASRNWQEFPEPERIALKSTIRLGKHHLCRVTALAAKV